MATVTILNRTGCAVGFGGGVRRAIVLVLTHAERAVPIKIIPPKIPIMNFGNPNINMNTVESPNCTSAPIQIFAPGTATITDPHIGHFDAVVSMRSIPHFAHLRIESMRGDYSTDERTQQLTKVITRSHILRINWKR